MAESFRSPRKIARRLRYLPRAMRKIQNWPAFMFHYALGLRPRSAYLFRNGAQLRISRALDHVLIIEIFLNEDYGVIPDRAVVLDLGANIGVFTVYAMTSARHVRIYAYEPWPEFFATLEANVRLNRRDESVRAFNFAVASSCGSRHLAMSNENTFFPALVSESSGKNEEDVLIDCTTLPQIMDSNDLTRVDLLKIDCEGAEYEILYATPTSYLQRIHAIRMEYHNLDSGDRHVEHLKPFLAKNGFATVRQSSTSATNGTIWAEREESEEAHD